MVEKSPDPDDQPSEQGLRYIREALLGLRFGEVTVIVQDGVVVQVERTERKRVERTGRKR